MLVATVSEISMESINDSLVSTNECLCPGSAYCPFSISVCVCFLFSTEACLTADPWVASLILARSLTSVETDHKLISTFILIPSVESFKKGCGQLQANICARSTG